MRVRLLRVGAAIVRNTRRVRAMLASHHPLCKIFLTAAQALAPQATASALSRHADKQRGKGAVPSKFACLAPPRQQVVQASCKKSPLTRLDRLMMKYPG
ncbi:MAG: hypothetical protein HY661_02665 [Betaproteobacteria bacterium]|nr:hypothetical protein [Betaproteobacteria bacterium]